jgi:hypothetical protein
MPAPLVDRSLALAAEGGPWTLLGLALATLASEDLACIAAGLLVAQGAISFPAATAACLAGILVGDLALDVPSWPCWRKSQHGRRIFLREP